MGSNPTGNDVFKEYDILGENIFPVGDTAIQKVLVVAVEVFVEYQNIAAAVVANILE